MLDEIYLDAEERMNKSVDATKLHFASVRTGRATPALLDHLKIDYYGAQTPLNQLANVSAPEPRLLVVQAFDKTAVPEIVKAITMSDLGFNPNDEGNVIRIPIPALTEERRIEMVKYVHKLTEEGKIAIRNIRRDANQQIDQLKSDSKVSEDDARIAHDNIQEDTNEHIKTLDAMMAKKESEIMEE